jgi:hypothetical protein
VCDGDVARIGADAASAARQSAPVIPGEPTTRTEPELYFVSLAPLGGTSRRISSVTSRCRVSPASMPMSATSTSPAWKRPGATTSPTFGRVHRHCHVCGDGRPGDLAGRPVDAGGKVDGHDRHGAPR